jgi:hypothetical protein
MEEEKVIQEQNQKIDPKKDKEIQSIVGAISKLMHGKETKGKLYEMLKSAPPDKSVPQATLLSTDRVIKAMKSKTGKTPSIEAIFAGSVFAIGELIEIGNAGGFFEEEIGEENGAPVLQASLEAVITNGVKNDTIDPIELQEKVEGLLSEEQIQMGLEAGARTGVPREPGVSHAMEKYASDRVKKDREITANKMSAKSQQQSMIQRASAQGGL